MLAHRILDRTLDAIMAPFVSHDRLPGPGTAHRITRAVTACGQSGASHVVNPGMAVTLTHDVTIETSARFRGDIRPSCRRRTQPDQSSVRTPGRSPLQITRVDARFTTLIS